MSQVLSKGGTKPDGPDEELIHRRHPNGGIGFVLAYGLSALIISAIVGLLLSEYSTIKVAAGYVLIGAAYGMLIYVLPRSGYVPVMGHELYDPFAG